MITTEKALQLQMHKDFFDRCQQAIDNGFYSEAILMEYAAMEARLEIIMGVIGFPCNKTLPDNERTKINISARLDCLQAVMKKSDVFSASKLPEKFFKDLKTWTAKRNTYVHGLYKDGMKYNDRMKCISELAAKGYEYCYLLYNEAKRLRRLRKETLPDVSQLCNRKRCKYMKENGALQHSS